MAVSDGVPHCARAAGSAKGANTASGAAGTSRSNTKVACSVRAIVISPYRVDIPHQYDECAHCNSTAIHLAIVTPAYGDTMSSLKPRLQFAPSVERQTSLKAPKPNPPMSHSELLWVMTVASARGANGAPRRFLPPVHTIGAGPDIVVANCSVVVRVADSG